MSRKNTSLVIIALLVLAMILPVFHVSETCEMSCCETGDSACQMMNDGSCDMDLVACDLAVLLPLVVVPVNVQNQNNDMAYQALYDNPVATLIPIHDRISSHDHFSIHDPPIHFNLPLLI